MICLDRSVAKPGETPEIAEAANLLREFQNSGAAHLIEQSRQEQSTIRQAMESMRAPWLDMKNRIASITGFVELQSIGHALRDPAVLRHEARRPAADRSWRLARENHLPEAIFTAPLARTEFYRARGLDPGLTNLPAGEAEALAGILGWSKNRPVRQQDLPRRLCEKDALSGNELDELMALAKDVSGSYRQDCPVSPAAAGPACLAGRRRGS